MLPELLFIVLLLLSYLIGSISTAIIVCKMFNLPDSRTQGSNNPGATNVLRIGGKKAAAITLIGDGLKGAIPVLIAHYLAFNMLNVTWVILVTFLGHVYPIFFSFKGGKGVATFLGALLALSYLTGLSFIITWVFVAKVLKISSLSALISTVLTPVYFYLITNNLASTYVIILICLWIFYTHQSNIKRLLNSQENKIN
ncbi:acyl-phosphate glycerol-3-phosphate acyltransferase [Candidatus Ruthia magnifica str. Cm (Calyptogena magnifica)]|uniref:Glycerol-3-phosphate acyltransferase n=1 Tax=Ruthia magnifica subsp. Calyptogena magnifica TaxID=413404 RepID=PLSY_RUTMC|nr:glycerol-3-phosphate 1-O-acyltransferase PlsY [Candidatus Ruthturnera calyptogenae]A1AXL0.1 RecName: Full=Glycerol-3-phosphate acyltransferase; AltName: Full=Acyl-PO4 G3P acyltransferase; AltName: Full=Acyl-phosphate--glycerol-3-phosphate acyltransferase; AltName: Full=G3P acyltransferase; Short=GPAT; AltName: Full=Lysophosphatidic acid synthase; Short=LPA synthase [Candidatus Ruthia magnifica str. Cm (Calyptogena magnifica)]ABL02667.1 acyl-phosphate glycerol-3-phosphate acyltransferase [Candi